MEVIDMLIRAKTNSDQHFCMDYLFYDQKHPRFK